MLYGKERNLKQFKYKYHSLRSCYTVKKEVRSIKIKYHLLCSGITVQKEMKRIRKEIWLWKFDWLFTHDIMMTYMVFYFI